MMAEPAAQEDASVLLLAGLQRRNARTRASGVVVESYRALLAAHTRLERQHAELQQRATELRQEKAELSRDVALLTNESNLGVSATHIEQLQDKVAALQNEVSVLAREKADALAHVAREGSAAESARVALAASELKRQASADGAHAGREAAGALRAELEVSRALAAERAGRVAALEAENGALVSRFLEKVSSQVDALNDGVDLHERLAEAQRQVAALALANEALRGGAGAARAPAGDETGPAR